eukprot:m.518242 g.518242  ORF g.518242 m.518242 type:complete len:110 (+) comp57483_c0_seq41:113-442(+)
MFDFVRQYVRTRIVAPVQQAFQDGMHPTDIAASFTLGALSGLWPIPGTTVVITFLLCYLARAVTSDWSVSIVLAQGLFSGVSCCSLGVFSPSFSLKSARVRRADELVPS